MRRSRFSVEQIVAVLKQAELGMDITKLIRKMGTSEQTFYRWKKQYGSLQPDQARELSQLQQENARLKKLVADLSLDKAILQDIAKEIGATRAEGRIGGVDGTRTRDPRRDRPVHQVKIHAACGPKPNSKIGKFDVELARVAEVQFQIFSPCF